MNIKEIKELVKMLDGTDITEFDYEHEGTKVLIKKGIGGMPQVMPVAPAVPQVSLPVQQVASALSEDDQAVSAPAAIPDKKDSCNLNQMTITAPMVGTFYRSPSPEAAPYVQLGQVVEVGQVVCIIEAMKLMNEIESECRGKVVNILVENGQPVEYGQQLFVIEKI